MHVSIFLLTCLIEIKHKNKKNLFVSAAIGVHAFTSNTNLDVLGQHSISYIAVGHTQ